MMRDVRIALAVGLALIAIAVVVVLSHSPTVLVAGNGIETSTRLASVPGGGSGCQTGETLPAGTSAISISLETSAGPRVAVEVVSRGRIVAHGEGPNGWLADAVTIPIRPLDRTVHDATVCFAFNGANERVWFLGTPTPAKRAVTSAGRPLRGRMAIEYLRTGSSSWWSLALQIARRMGLGRAWPGASIVLLVTSLMGAAIALAAWLAIRDP
jgi:hypothetical protein